nr:MAG TPA_asm: hypothetical protein [Caudoviricetes sp.]
MFFIVARIVTSLWWAVWGRFGAPGGFSGRPTLHSSPPVDWSRRW